MPTDHKPTLPPPKAAKPHEPRGPNEPMEVYFRRITGLDVTSPDGQGLAMSITVFGVLRDPTTSHDLAHDIFNNWISHVRADAAYEMIKTIIEAKETIDDHAATLTALAIVIETSGKHARTTWSRLYNLLSIAPRFAKEPPK